MSEKTTVTQALLQRLQRSADHILSKSWTTRDGKVFSNRDEALAHMKKLAKKK